MAIPVREQRILLQQSGNVCAFAECRRPLTAMTPDGQRAVLGEMAHIVAESLEGPRGDHPMSPEERNSHTNLILLCNNHHQLIDDPAQAGYFTVDRLLGIKEAHEAWVEKSLGHDSAADNRVVRPPRVTEVVHSTLLPVERMPAYVYGAPCDLAEREVQGRLGRLRQGEMAPYIVRGHMLYTFQDLAENGNPFGPVVVGQPVDRFQAQEWWDDSERLVWFIQLLNRALNKLTGRLGLQFDREHRRYYFAPTEPGSALAIEYRPLNQQRASRFVVWQPKRRSTGEVRPYWFHRAVALRFLRIGEQSWCLSVRPELRVTVDGVKPPPAEKVGGKVTRKKSRTFNYPLLAEVHFWRDFLSSSKPRILLPFGHTGQVIVIPTTLMQGQVEWPGIPEEHAKPFKNVEYLDDLFSWAEFQSVDFGLDESDDDDWSDDGEGEGDDDEPR